MRVYRTIAFALLSASVTAWAQPAPQGQQPEAANQQKPNPDDKVSCRISKEGNSLKRTCMTRSQWKKADSESQNVDEGGLRNPRCPNGAC